MLGECIPGGTTTALCVLRALGYPARTSSSYQRTRPSRRRPWPGAWPSASRGWSDAPLRRSFARRGPHDRGRPRGSRRRIEGTLLLAEARRCSRWRPSSQALGTARPAIVTTCYVRGRRQREFRRTRGPGGCRAHLRRPGLRRASATRASHGTASARSRRGWVPAAPRPRRAPRPQSRRASTGPRRRGTRKRFAHLFKKAHLIPNATHLRGQQLRAVQPPDPPDAAGPRDRGANGTEHDPAGGGRRGMSRGHSRRRPLDRAGWPGRRIPRPRPPRARDLPRAPRDRRPIRGHGLPGSARLGTERSRSRLRSTTILEDTPTGSRSGPPTRMRSRCSRRASASSPARRSARPRRSPIGSDRSSGSSGTPRSATSAEGRRVYENFDRSAVTEAELEPHDGDRLTGGRSPGSASDVSGAATAAAGVGDDGFPRDGRTGGGPPARGRRASPVRGDGRSGSPTEVLGRRLAMSPRLVPRGIGAGACRFHIGSRCTIYEARPWICRTYPFMLDGDGSPPPVPRARRTMTRESARDLAADSSSRRRSGGGGGRAVAGVLASARLPEGRRVVVDGRGIRVI